MSKEYQRWNSLSSQSWLIGKVGRTKGEIHKAQGNKGWRVKLISLSNSSPLKTKMDITALRSLTLIHELEQYILEHPRFADRIPNGAQVVLLPTYDQELREYNLRNAKINAEPGRPVVHIEIDRLRPRRSQIVRPRLKVDRNSLNNNGRKRRKRAIASNA